MLGLPTELRLAILEYLIVFPEPLRDIVLDAENRPRRCRNYEGTVQIVTTCRQLAHEALPLFYEKNCFEILIYTPSDSIDTRMVMLGEELSVDRRPTALSRARRLRVHLRGWPCEMDEDETWTDRQTVHQLCEILRATVDLTQVKLDVDLKYRWPLSEDNTIREAEILQPLSFLRGVKLARVTGIDMGHASALQRIMMTPESMENIWQMKTAFQDWCEAWTGDVHNDMDTDATEALYACDIPGFKWHRMNIIRKLNALHDSSVREVFKI